jgi:hypothetical protein
MDLSSEMSDFITTGRCPKWSRSITIPILELPPGLNTGPEEGDAIHTYPPGLKKFSMASIPKAFGCILLKDYQHLNLSQLGGVA